MIGAATTKCTGCPCDEAYCEGSCLLDAMSAGAGVAFSEGAYVDTGDCSKQACKHGGEL